MSPRQPGKEMLLEKRYQKEHERIARLLEEDHSLN
jgi:hypothetical protein